jgi:hypothetical protein
MPEDLEQYSLPLKEVNTELGTIIWLNSRQSEPGRLFRPLGDIRHPLKFPVEYIYLSDFSTVDNTSGSHYHKEKEELLFPLTGLFEVLLENIQTHQSETVTLDSLDHIALYIRPGIAHRIVSLEESGLLLVHASTPASLEDTFAYEFTNQ